MKTPPGPMIIGLVTRPPPTRPARGATAPAERPVRDRPARTAVCAVGLAVALGLAGAVVLAPYGGAASTTELSTTTGPTTVGPTTVAP